MGCVNRKETVISAGHADNFIIRDDMILKCTKDCEMNFYAGLEDKTSEFAD